MAKFGLTRIRSLVNPCLKLAAVMFLAVLLLKGLDSARLGRVDVTIHGIAVAGLFVLVFSFAFVLGLVPILNFIARKRYRKKQKLLVE
jgi:hypothetical protein